MLYTILGGNTQQFGDYFSMTDGASLLVKDVNETIHTVGHHGTYNVQGTNEGDKGKCHHNNVPTRKFQSSPSTNPTNSTGNSLSSSIYVTMYRVANGMGLGHQVKILFSYMFSLLHRINPNSLM